MPYMFLLLHFHSAPCFQLTYSDPCPYPSYLIWSILRLLPLSVSPVPCLYPPYSLLFSFLSCSLRPYLVFTLPVLFLFLSTLHPALPLSSHIPFPSRPLRPFLFISLALSIPYCPSPALTHCPSSSRFFHHSYLPRPAHLRDP